MSQHTQGKLRYDYEPGFCGELLRDNGTMVCSFVDEPNKADARRLVAAWNAAEGLSTEALETAGNAFNGWKLASYAMNDAKAQRDELLQALKALRKAYVKLLESGRDRIVSLGGMCDPVDAMEASDPYLKEARAAINKAEGGAA